MQLYQFSYPYYPVKGYYPQGYRYYQSNTRNSNPLKRQYQLRDYGPYPYVVNINEISKENPNFRLALWTGKHFQLTLMSINVGEDIGLEIHPNTDQFLRIEEGRGIMQMGPSRNQLTFERNVGDDFAIFIPAGTWHNLTNTGNTPLKLYSIYAPVQHPYGTIHQTKADSEAAES